MVRLGPDHRAAMRASVVGYAMPAETPPSNRATMSTSSVGEYTAQQARRDRQGDAEDQHHLATVPVAEGTEIQHRRRQTQRVAHRDQVHRGLRGVEGLADVGKCHVGDGKVEVGDRGDQDQGKQDPPGARGRRADRPAPMRQHSGGTTAMHCPSRPHPPEHDLVVRQPPVSTNPREWYSPNAAWLSGATDRAACRNGVPESDGSSRPHQVHKASTVALPRPARWCSASMTRPPIQWLSSSGSTAHMTWPTVVPRSSCTAQECHKPSYAERHR